MGWRSVLCQFIESSEMLITQAICVGMINWNDPDYTAAGNEFQALVSSVSVKCADPTPPSGNMTSYIYGSNSSTSTPNVTISSASTLLNGSGSSSISSSLVKKIGISVGVGLLALIISALLVRACVQRRRRSARATKTIAPTFGGQAYSALKDPSVGAADTHPMPALNYGGDQYPPQPPAYGGQQSYNSPPQYSGGQQPYGYGSEQHFRR